MEKTKKTNIRMIIVIAFLLICGIITYVSIRGEYLYNLELGASYVEKFMQSLKYNCAISGVICFILFFYFYIINIFLIRGLNKFFVEEKQQKSKLPNKSLALVLGLVLTIIIVPEISSRIVLFMNATSFEIYDDVFGKDIGYYIFNLSTIELIFKYVILVAVASFFYVVVYYIMALNIYFNGVDIELLKKNTVIKVIIAILMLIAFSISVLVYLSSFNVLFNNFIEINKNIELVGAGSVDILLKVWGIRILALIIFISAILIIKNVKSGSRRKIIESVLIVPIYIFALVLLMFIYQIIFVNPNKLDSEYNYINYNIKNTRKAYGIEAEEKDIEYSGTLNLDEVELNSNIIDNIPIINQDITLTTLKEYKNKQGYYSFNNTKLLDYNNKLVYVTPREVINNSKSISKTNKTYEYTHGYGAIITSAVETDENGGIKYLQNDFEEKKNNFINIKEPRIYFGLETNNAIVIGAGEKEEFDYPISTTEIKNNSYLGEAGLKIGFFDRLVLAIKEKNMGIIFTKDSNGDSKILFNRNILGRVNKILPELIYDENPYLILNEENGHLVWVIDGYTISDKYPYSNFSTININGSRKSINYIRNSVKVIVDSYTGEVSYYITDRSDPIIMAYRNIYPSIFKELGEKIPISISDHITYPEILYDIQSQMINLYHNVKPEVLYRGDDIWKIATYQQSSTSKIMKNLQNYIMYNNYLSIVVPYTMDNKQSLNSYLIGYYNPNTQENKLIINKFNANNGILGPKMLELQITEDIGIFNKIEEISVTGTKIIKDLYVVPINNTILYVEPIYQLLVNETNVPVLKKVIVSSGTKLAIGDNLNIALINLLSQNAVDIEIENTDDIEAVIQLIIKANNNLKASSESNNWTLMGQDIERLQKLIDQLQDLRKDTESETKKMEIQVNEEQEKSGGLIEELKKKLNSMKNENKVENSNIVNNEVNIIETNVIE